jgi:hypothetical protein
MKSFTVHVLFGSVSYQMDNSDKQQGRKEVERIELDYFLDAYKHTTGENLILIASGEQPDFICTRSNGENVGIELVCDIHESDRLIKIIDKTFQSEPLE